MSLEINHCCRQMMMMMKIKKMFVGVFLILTLLMLLESCFVVVFDCVYHNCYCCDYDFFDLDGDGDYYETMIVAMVVATVVVDVMINYVNNNHPLIFFF